MFIGKAGDEVNWAGLSIDGIGLRQIMWPVAD